MARGRRAGDGKQRGDRDAVCRAPHDRLRPRPAGPGGGAPRLPLTRPARGGQNGAMRLNAGGLVYGTIIVATLLAAESARSETYGKTVGAVALAMLTYWLRVSYSPYSGGGLAEGE